ncbi:unnamed protein product [Bemisia tabaci]|uniref:Lipocalin/cytosolic fatty-acid binding domain-containing protein n=1 Tax=Bemisia tabaci TaxID=7038 RepID=A0AAI8UU30_BEMTA|nr:unnamed protein product [Bemisia tabaci]
MSPYIVSAIFAAVLGLANAQVPGFGGCPEFVAMSDFDMSRFLGTWYEAERYVNIFEAGTRCVRTNYTKANDGRYLVSNEITNRYTGVKRVLEGEIRLVVKGAESKLNVRYPNLPIPYDTQYSVLETDYDDYAVIWSCSSLGIVNTQQAWVLTRQKLPSGTTLQKAYGVLDKFKLSRSFFFKTDQESCNLAETIKTDQAAKDGADNVVPEVIAAASEVEPVKVPAPVAAPPAAAPAPVVAAPVAAQVAPHHDHKEGHKDHKEKPVTDASHHHHQHQTHHVHKDAPHKDSVHKDSVHKDSVHKDSVHKDSVHKEVYQQFPKH